MTDFNFTEDTSDVEVGGDWFIIFTDGHVEAETEVPLDQVNESVQAYLNNEDVAVVVFPEGHVLARKQTDPPPAAAAVVRLFLGMMQQAFNAGGRYAILQAASIARGAGVAQQAHGPAAKPGVDYEPRGYL